MLGDTPSYSAPIVPALWAPAFLFICRAHKVGRNYSLTEFDLTSSGQERRSVQEAFEIFRHPEVTVAQVSFNRPNQHFPLTYNQMFGYIFGIVYVAVGAAGYAATNGIGLTAHLGGRELHWFGVNPLHNVVHLAVGAALMISAFAGPRVSRGVNTLFGAVYLLLALAGPIITLSPAVNILGLNFADDVLHLLTAVVALTVALYLGRIDELQSA